MMLALASSAAGFGHLVNGYWYPGATGQLVLLYAFTVLFTFMGSFWFGLAFKQRPMRSWMEGALKATIAWTVAIVAAVLVPIGLYGAGVGALTDKVVGGMTITPFIAESIVGSLAFGMTITVMVLVVAFFYTKGAAWFLKS
ncbi:MAG TPA: hypothetical protein V6D00_05425 [Pantanalinema sp.]